MLRVSDLSEGELLSRIVPLLPPGKQTLLGPGDDCAVISSSGSFVVTTDILVEGHHFRSHWSNGNEVGARAAAQNLADIAAMGAYPTALVVSLVLPPDLSVDWLGDFAGGMASIVGPTGAGVVGGDLSGGEQLVISVTAHGRLGGAPITRTGARPGDTLAIVGTLGRSAAGWSALDSGAVSPDLHGGYVPMPFTEPVAIYRTPRPPLSAGPLAAGKGATSMMDVSDGLIVDSGRLAQASQVVLDINSEGLREDLATLQEIAVALGSDPLQWVLFGGEDHSLLVTFPAHVLVTEPFRSIGSVGAPTPTLAAGTVRVDGRPISGGWDHFRQ